MKSNSITITLILASILTVVLVLISRWKAKAEREPEPFISDNHLAVNLPYNKQGKPKTANFDCDEFDCKDGTTVPTEYYGNLQLLMMQLQVIRDYFKLPIVINSGYRTKKYNASLAGAASNSMHLHAKAADIVIIGKSPAKVRKGILKLIADKKIIDGGLGAYSTFTHYDIGPSSRWTK